MNIAIRVPDELELKVSIFPFLHALDRSLDELIDESEVLNIHLISSAESLRALNFLPMKAYYQTIPKDDLNNIFAAHRNLGSLKHTKVDLYISMTENFVDVMIGRNLKAKKRVGFAKGKNSFFLTDKVEIKETGHFTDRYIGFLAKIGVGKPKIRRVSSRTFDPYFKDTKENPYIVLNIEVIEDELNTHWLDLISHFEDQRFIIMSDALDKNDQKLKLTEFANKNKSKNTIEVFETEDLIDFGKLVQNSEVFISGDSPYVALAGYCGTQVFNLNRQKNDDMDNRYFIGDTVVCSIHDAYYKDGLDFHYGKFFDEVLEYVDIKIKKRESK